MKSTQHMPVYAPTDPDESMDAIGQRIKDLARERPDHIALIDGETQLNWQALVR